MPVRELSSNERQISCLSDETVSGIEPKMEFVETFKENNFGKLPISLGKDPWSPQNPS